MTGPQRTDKPVEAIKADSLTGKIFPWADEQPVLLGMPGSDLLYLPCFSTEEALLALMGRTGSQGFTIKLIEDGNEFLNGILESPGAGSVRVILDPYFLPNGHVRFVQVENLAATQTIEKLRGSDWGYAFQCCGVETKEQVANWGDKYAQYSSRYNEPKVNAVLGCSVTTEPFTRDDIAELIACADGENDGPDWIAVMRLKDGRFAFLTAGCDYTGWDCQSGGNAFVADSLARLWQYGVDENARARLAEQMSEHIT